jgi:hypothetical protein
VKFSSFFLKFIENDQDSGISESFERFVWRHAFIPFPETHPTLDKYIGEGHLVKRKKRGLLQRICRILGVFESMEQKFVLHGRGTLIYANGLVYEGYLEENQRNGYGILMTGKTVVRANFKNDMAKFGAVHYLNGGHWYEGGLNNTFQKHGKGTLHSVEMRDIDAGTRNAFCDGEWQNDKRTAASVIKMFEFIWSQPADSNLVHEPWFKSFMTQVSCVVNCRDLVSSRGWKDSESNLPGTKSNPYHPAFEQNINADQNWMQLVTVGKFNVYERLPIPPPDHNYETKSLYELLRPAVPTSVSDDDIRQLIDLADKALEKNLDSQPDAMSVVTNADLSPVQAQSIAIYTCELKKKPSVYGLFNEAIRSLDAEQIGPWSSYAAMFQSAIDKLKAPPPTYPDASPKFTVV